jgi:hypothetical protein
MVYSYNYLLLGHPLSGILFKNNVLETGLGLCPERGTSSIDLAQLSKLLPQHGDRVQSPKRRF